MHTQSDTLIFVVLYFSFPLRCTSSLFYVLHGKSCNSICVMFRFNYLISSSHRFLLKSWYQLPLPIINLSAWFDFACYLSIPTDSSRRFLTFLLMIFSFVLAADLIHVFSSVPRHLNFIDHTSDIGWKEYVLSEHSNSEWHS